ncbi:hypothetical protein K1719_041593 [Acacia pycnantha]|nr:hypothetical protein K1719_041593 [Acacia pycnantha]
MLEKVFDFEDLNDYYKEMDLSSVVVPLKKLKLWSLPKLKNVWSDYYQRKVSFPSLRSVDFSYCESLTSIFPASIAKGMLCDLEELKIRRCGVEVIVAKDQVSKSVAVTFEFPKLTSLRLNGLPNLRNFYSQKHTLEWPHLNELSIQCCDGLEIFEKEISGSLEIFEEENMLDSKYPLLPHDKVMGNLERLTLQGKEVEKIGGGELKLSGDFEKALGGDNVAALTAHFPQLTLENVSIMGGLSPSLVSSPNLTHLNVKWCNGTTLMTSSIARSLVHLMHLSISKCNQMEEIITKQGEDDEVKLIFFNKMKFLELDDLKELKRFCGYNYTFKFLLLDQLIIKECPKFMIFSPGLIETPSLKSVQLGKDWKKHHEILDTDLNKTVYNQRYVTSRKLVLDEDDAIMIRNDQFPADCPRSLFSHNKVLLPKLEILKLSNLNRLIPSIWDDHLLHNSFNNLKTLTVEKCGFVKLVPFVC